MELGYFYDEGDFLILKRYAIANPDIAIITPNPIYSCEEPSRQDIDDRQIMGCHLVGTLMNMSYYKERGFVEKYYQTTFDYEYCLYHRSIGRKVVLMQNAIMRNANYRIKEKRVFFMRTWIYERDLLDLYYQTRNRMYLWDDYKDIDPIFVKLDKKDFKKEKTEMPAHNILYQCRDIGGDTSQALEKGRIVPVRAFYWRYGWQSDVKLRH
jgi:hypothetical protein